MRTYELINAESEPSAARNILTKYKQRQSKKGDKMLRKLILAGTANSSERFRTEANQIRVQREKQQVNFLHFLSLNCFFKNHPMILILF